MGGQLSVCNQSKCKKLFPKPNLLAHVGDNEDLAIWREGD